MPLADAENRRERRQDSWRRRAQSATGGRGRSARPRSGPNCCPLGAGESSPVGGHRERPLVTRHWQHHHLGDRLAGAHPPDCRTATDLTRWPGRIGHGPVLRRESVGKLRHRQLELRRERAGRAIDPDDPNGTERRRGSHAVHIRTTTVRVGRPQPDESVQRVQERDAALRPRGVVEHDPARDSVQLDRAAARQRQRADPTDDVPLPVRVILRVERRGSRGAGIDELV